MSKISDKAGARAAGDRIGIKKGLITGTKALWNPSQTFKQIFKKI
jgi:hypothetical protein